MSTKHDIMKITAQMQKLTLDIVEQSASLDNKEKKRVERNIQVLSAALKDIRSVVRE